MDAYLDAADHAGGGPGVTIIRIRERSRGVGRFLATVSFGDDSEFDLDLAEQPDDAGKGNWAWYFGERLRYPFEDADRDALSVREFTAYGEALFTQVFGGAANHD